MFLFLLGKNPEIAKLEVCNYLSRFQIEEIINEANYLIVSFNNNDDFESKAYSLMKDLGGVIRIAKFIHSDSDINSIAFEKLDFYFPKKFNYALSTINLDNLETKLVESFAKNEVKKYKSKGVLQKSPNEILEPSKYHSAKINEGFEVIVLKKYDKFEFFQTLAATNPKDYEFKDNSRPSKVVSHGSSFRLAQIMVNILNLNENKTLIDPFCGTGTFLIEGLLKNLNVIGIDNDPELISSANVNVAWAREEYRLKNSSQIIFGDSQNEKFFGDGVAFEPYMGPFLKSLPRRKEGLEIVEELFKLYSNVFRNLKNNTSDNSRIVFIQPSIQTKSGEVLHIDEKFYTPHGFKLVNWSDYFKNIKLENLIPYEASDGSTLLRRLTVVEKN
jgi:tRNA G10  N-methylase Trm11